MTVAAFTAQVSSQKQPDFGNLPTQSSSCTDGQTETSNVASSHLPSVCRENKSPNSSPALSCPHFQSLHQNKVCGTLNKPDMRSGHGKTEAKEWSNPTTSHSTIYLSVNVKWWRSSHQNHHEISPFLSSQNQSQPAALWFHVYGPEISLNNPFL